MEICNVCHGYGQMESECCNGAGGCSCHGDVVLLPCTYCDGKGTVESNIEASENGLRKFRKFYGGRCFLGSGPSSGYWAGK